MTITALPTAPSRSMTPAEFIAAADAWLAAQATFVTELNVVAAAMNMNATSDTSASSVAIGTGAKTFTVTAGKSFLGGMFLVIADTAAPSTNWMFGQVTSYTSTTLVMNITSVGGSGTKTAWTISQSGVNGSSSGYMPLSGSNMSGGINGAETVVAAATTPDIFAVTVGNLIDYTGTTTCTGFTAAPQAGAERTLVCADSAVFTAGANMLIDGVASGENFTAAGGDKIMVRAISTTKFRLTPQKYNGTGIAAESRIQGISASVAASALTISAGTLSLDFRSATIGSGAVSSTIPQKPANLVISSGSTLGTISATQSRIAVLAINNAGTIELAAVNISGGTNLTETGVISTTAEGGAGAADSASVVYSTTARTNVAYRVIGYVESTQATAGTWATAPSTIQGAGGAALAAMASIGYGQTWSNPARSSGVTYYNTTGRPITLALSTNGNGTLVVTVAGVTVFNQPTGGAYAGCVSVLIPPGASYAYTSTVVSTVAELS